MADMLACYVASFGEVIWLIVIINAFFALAHISKITYCHIHKIDLSYTKQDSGQTPRIKRER